MTPLNPSLHIQAFDDDPNTVISYSITFSDTTPSSPLFTIGSSSGQISASSLDYEAITSHTYRLTVIASDAGTPILSASCAVTVNIRVSNHTLLNIE